MTPGEKIAHEWIGEHDPRGVGLMAEEIDAAIAAAVAEEREAIWRMAKDQEAYWRHDALDAREQGEQQEAAEADRHGNVLNNLAAAIRARAATASAATTKEK